MAPNQTEPQTTPFLCFLYVYINSVVGTRVKLSEYCFSTAVPETGEERKPPNIFNIHKEATPASSNSNLKPQV
jgi:hypothetical protein